MKLVALLLLVAFLGMVVRRRKAETCGDRVTWPAKVHWLPDFRDGEPDGV